MRGIASANEGSYFLFVELSHFPRFSMAPKGIGKNPQTTGFEFCHVPLNVHLPHKIMDHSQMNSNV